MAGEVFPPAEYIRDELEARGWSEAKLAYRAVIPVDPAALSRLECLAQAASPGPYRCRDWEGVADDTAEMVEMKHGTWRYLSALDPATTLQLIAAARREAGLRAALERLMGALRHGGIFSDAGHREGPISDAGRAAVAALEAKHGTGPT